MFLRVSHATQRFSRNKVETNPLRKPCHQCHDCKSFTPVHDRSFRSIGITTMQIKSTQRCIMIRTHKKTVVTLEVDAQSCWGSWTIGQPSPGLVPSGRLSTLASSDWLLGRERGVTTCSRLSSHPQLDDRFQSSCCSPAVHLSDDSPLYNRISCNLRRSVPSDCSNVFSLRPRRRIIRARVG
jgi:hypothetical protein